MFGYLLEQSRYLNIVGIIVIAVIAWLFSENRKAINKRLVLSALLVHFAFAITMLRTAIGQSVMQGIADGAATLYLFAEKGIEFMFGRLGDQTMSWGFIFAFKVLPVIIFVGALTGLLFHWGIIQRIVIGMNAVIRPIIGASGVETISAIANSILGQTEAALFMNNYITIMTRSELFVLMCSGMAAISISVLVVYTQIGIPGVHLLTASLMSVPASIFIAKMLVPETEKSVSVKNPYINFEKKTANSFDAISKGTMDGLQLALAVGAMLIAFPALIEMIDFLLSLLSTSLNNWFSLSLPSFSIATFFSYLFAPFAYLLGLTGTELWDAGKLLGIKVSANELIAFSHLVKTSVSPRTFTILVYALCGFSNFSCIGIQIGMINALAPEKKHTVTQLGLYAVLGSSLANLLSAMIVGLLL